MMDEINLQSSVFLNEMMLLIPGVFGSFEMMATNNSKGCPASEAATEPGKLRRVVH